MSCCQSRQCNLPVPVSVLLLISNMRLIWDPAPLHMAVGRMFAWQTGLWVAEGLEPSTGPMIMSKAVVTTMIWVITKGRWPRVEMVWALWVITACYDMSSYLNI